MALGVTLGSGPLSNWGPEFPFKSKVEGATTGHAPVGCPAPYDD